MLSQVIYAIKNSRKWKRWVRDLYLDLKYGGKFLGGNISNGNFVMGWSPSTSSDYDAISNLFSLINFKPNDVLVDIGCGKGRIFNWMLHNKIKSQLIGIEVNSTIAEFCRKRLKKYSQIKVITGSIFDQNIFPLDGTIYYLFNPFSKKTIELVADQLSTLKNNITESDRPLIIYYNCCYLDVFENNPIWKIKKFSDVSSMGLSAAIISFKKE